MFFYKILSKQILCVFFLQNFIKPYESHLSRHTFNPLKKIVKIIKKKIGSKQPKCPKIDKKNCKTHDVDKVHWWQVFKSFFVFHPEAKHRKLLKKGQNCFKNVVSDFCK